MSVYLGVVLLGVCSLVVGAAISALAGEDRPDGRAGLVGFALLLVVAPAAAKLPGDGSVIAAVLALLVVASLAVVVRRGRAWPRVGWVGVAVVAGGLAATAVPFYATSRIGILGVSFNNDTAVHLVWAEGLRSDVMRHLYGIPEGYPLGPHAVLAGLGSFTSLELDHLLTAMLVVIPVLTGLAVLELLRPIVAPVRVAVALLVAFGYLLSGYYGQGAFKESIHAGLLLAFTAGLQRLLDGPPEGRVRAALGLGLLVAADVQTYSYLALAWYAAAVGIAAVLLVLRSPRRALQLAALRTTVLPLIAGAAVLVVALLPEASRILTFFHQIGPSPSGGGSSGIPTTNLGNLAGPLPFAEALGVWPSPDFRLPVPAGAFFAVGTLQLAVAAAAICGAVWLVARRQVALAAAGLGALAIWYVSDGHQSPYVTAKALLVLAPFVVALAFRGLLDGPVPFGGGAVLKAGWVARLAIAALLASGLVWSSLQVLRGSAVESTTQRDELVSFRGLLRGGDTIFLGIDDHVGWRLRGARLAYLGYPAPPLPLPLDPAVAYTYGRPIDFDSVAPADLDRFRYVIVNRAAYASSPPANVRLLRRTRSFELFERTGATPPRVVPPHSTGQPGADLRCQRARPPKARRAVVFPGRPVVSAGAGALVPGAAATVSVALPRGEWDLALSYVSVVKVRIVLARRTWIMPASTGRPGNFVGFGRVRSNGHLPPFTVIADRASRLTGTTDIAIVGSIAAVPVGTPRTMSARAACGRYIDRLLP